LGIPVPVVHPRPGVDRRKNGIHEEADAEVEAAIQSCVHLRRVSHDHQPLAILRRWLEREPISKVRRGVSAGELLIRAYRDATERRQRGDELWLLVVLAHVVREAAAASG